MRQTWKLFAVLPALALAGCGAGVATETRVQIVRVPVPAPCPAKPEYDKLKASRPRPLREQQMPATAEERSAKVQAQLGRFEAEGGWADRAEAALDRCALVEAVAPSP